MDNSKKIRYFDLLVKINSARLGPGIGNNTLQFN